MQQEHRKPQLSLYLGSILVAGIVGPLAIQLHEVVGHWFPAKLLGAKNLTIGYTNVDMGTAEQWPSSKQLPAIAGGPLVTNFSLGAGLFLMKTGNTPLKLVGFAIINTSYRAFLVIFRQLLGEKSFEFNKGTEPLTRELNLCDESLLAKGLKIPRPFISVPQVLYTLWVLWEAIKLLPGKNKGLLELTTFSGIILGTLLYITRIGPFLWPGQKKVTGLKLLSQKDNLGFLSG
ncbi:MAG TPA: hypothetical protein VH186_32180 [Chloroflexia bacterium]|nr:hypothetical protein [Chloroflexia bacterium]